MVSAKIKCNDEVIILTGRDKGKRGKVQRVLGNTGKAIVTGRNLIKKHQKSVPNKNQSGGIIEKEAPIHLSNLSVFNAITNKSDRVGFKIKDGKKVRIFKSTGDVIE